MNIIESVKQFNELAGNTTDRFNPRQMGLYFGLQGEEFAEKIQALIDVFEDDLRTKNIPKLMRLFHLRDVLSDVVLALKKGEYDSQLAEADQKEMLDADCDLIVVSIGAALSQGADIEGAMAEVIRSNDSKAVVFEPIGEKVLLKDENGKIQKGPLSTPPNLAPYLPK